MGTFCSEGNQFGYGVATSDLKDIQPIIGESERQNPNCRDILTSAAFLHRLPSSRNYWCQHVYQFAFGGYQEQPECHSYHIQNSQCILFLRVLRSISVRLKTTQWQIVRPRHFRLDRFLPQPDLLSLKLLPLFRWSQATYKMLMKACSKQTNLKLL